jgi:hypothetical protein
MLTILDEYAHTTAPILTVMVQIGRRACSLDAIPVMKQFIEAMPAPKLINHREGRRMVAALGRLNDFFQKKDDDVWRAAFELTAGLSSKSYAATHISARDLPKILPSLPEDSAVDYLRGLNRLVQTIGAGATSFGLSRLPDIYRRRGPGRANALVSAAATTAETYGATAAWWLLEQRTTAARAVVGR